MLKAIVNGAEKDIVRIPMLGDGPATVTGIDSVTFETDATSVIDYTIKGNLQQSGTPSSSSPIYPSETGDRTAQLINPDMVYNKSANATSGAYPAGEGGNRRTAFAYVEPNATYTVDIGSQITDRFVIAEFESIVDPETAGYEMLVPDRFIFTGNTSFTGSATFITGASAKMVMIYYSLNAVISNIMLNSGSTPLPYEPYGKYKFPITCGTTQNIYLQEPIRKIGDYVDTAGLSIGGADRKIKKLVLTGDEDYTKSTHIDAGLLSIYLFDTTNRYEKTWRQVCVCSHFGITSNVSGWDVVANKTCALYTQTQMPDYLLYIRDTTYSNNLQGFVQWIKDQYSAGTPVTVWYVLASEEHETATIPTITTTKGQNTLSIGTTLSPSSMEVTYLGIKNIYKEGWEVRNRFIARGLLEPFCGIGQYKDSLNLTTGAITRYVKKLVLDGTENWQLGSGATPYPYIAKADMPNTYLANSPLFCTHFINDGTGMMIGNSYALLTNYTNIASDIATWKTWLQQQYANGTPVTVWYVLATPEAEQTYVPFGLTGSVEGFITQSGTPTPTNPIYPNSNGIKESDGTYSVDTEKYAITFARNETLTGTSSISFRGYGLPLKSMSITGNGQQSGTPAPDAPIMPEFVGDRTGNLFDATWQSGSLGATGGEFSDINAVRSTPIPCGAENTYTFIPDIDGYDSIWVNYYGTTNTRERIDTSGGTFTTPQGCEQVRFRVTKTNIGVEPVQQYNAMLNSGSTALPYEPYGYKLPITNAGQTVPIYLGQTQTVRRIKKLVLTGTEIWTLYNGNYFSKVIDSTAKENNVCVCSHLPSAVNSGIYISNGGSNLKVFSASVSSVAQNLDAWKTYLQQQYSAGTPVTVWYVLKTPTTGIVNEPLMKVDDYADEVTVNTPIPTTIGANTVTVGTVLQPSAISIIGHIKPIS